MPKETTKKVGEVKASEKKDKSRKGPPLGVLRKSQKTLFARMPWCGLYKDLCATNASNASTPARPLAEIVGGDNGR